MGRTSEQERAEPSLEPFFSTAGRTNPAQPSGLAIAYGEIDSVLYRWSQSSERIGDRMLARECQVVAAVPSAPPEHTAEALEAAIAARLAAHPVLGLAPSTQSLLEDALGWAPALLVARLAVRCLALEPVSLALARAAAHPSPELAQLARAGLFSACVYKNLRDTLPGIEWNELSAKFGQQLAKDVDEQMVSELHRLSAKALATMELTAAQVGSSFFAHPAECYGPKFGNANYDPLLYQLLSLVGKPLSSVTLENILREKKEDPAFAIGALLNKERPLRLYLGVVIVVATSDIAPATLDLRGWQMEQQWQTNSMQAELDLREEKTLDSMAASETNAMMWTLKFFGVLLLFSLLLQLWKACFDPL